MDGWPGGGFSFKDQGGKGGQGCEERGGLGTGWIGHVFQMQRSQTIRTSSRAIRKGPTCVITCGTSSADTVGTGSLLSGDDGIAESG